MGFRTLLGVVARPGIFPAVLLAALVVADLSDGRSQSVLGLWVAVPLVAAFLARPGPVTVYAGASTVTATLLGFYDGSYTGSLSPQIERLVVIALSGLFGIGVSEIRRRREREFRETRLLADTVQEVLLPAVPPRVATADVATSYHAAAASARVGGDFFDVRATETAARLVIGDVRGKGLPAVRLASAVLAAFRERFEERLDIIDLVDDLNRAVVRESIDGEEFVTAIVAELDSDGVLTLAAAGHPPPLRVSARGVELLESDGSGTALGMVPDRPVGKHCRFRLDRGDRVLFYTDGVTEARDASGEFFPLVQAASTTLSCGGLRAALQRLEASLSSWTGGHLDDDAAFVLIELVPASNRPG